VRHSGCDEVQVEIALQGRRLVLRVSDNGEGFDSRSVALRGNGLQSMETRARQLGGRIEVLSSPGRGTTVHVILALTRRAAGARKAS
jgi:NarL family two-component system sensor histidine kinase LiaS